MHHAAAEYASIFALNAIPDISNRAIGLWELAPTGQEIARVLRKHHTGLTVNAHSLKKVNAELEICATTEPPLGMAWYSR